MTNHSTKSLNGSRFEIKAKSPPEKLWRASQEWPVLQRYTDHLEAILRCSDQQRVSLSYSDSARIESRICKKEGPKV